MSLSFITANLVSASKQLQYKHVLPIWPQNVALFGPDKYKILGNPSHIKLDHLKV